MDWSFIQKEEGNQRLNGYLPQDANKKPNPNSGVTIATGFDLHGRTRKGLDELGLDQQLVQKLLPYISPSLKGQVAQDFVHAHPLAVSKAEADLIDAKVRSYTVSTVAVAFDRASKTTPFLELPSGAQTAIIDLAHQYGTNLAAATPRFWSYVTSGDWIAARNELLQFHDAFGPRREKDAEKIDGDLKAGRLPARRNG